MQRRSNNSNPTIGDLKRAARIFSITVPATDVTKDPLCDVLERPFQLLRELEARHKRALDGGLIVCREARARLTSADRNRQCGTAHRSFCSSCRWVVEMCHQAGRTFCYCINNDHRCVLSTTARTSGCLLAEGYIPFSAVPADDSLLRGLSDKERFELQIREGNCVDENAQEVRTDELSRIFRPGSWVEVYCNLKMWANFDCPISR
jgi:hypothetical protein